MKKLGVLALLVLPLVLGACRSGGDGPKKPIYPKEMDVSGDVTISGASNVQGNLAQCSGVGVFADLKVGAPVSISTLTGKPVGIGGIIYAVGTNVFQNRLDQCTFRYIVKSVPRAPGYYLRVARQKVYPVDFVTLFRNRGVYDISLPTTTITTLPPNPLAPVVPSTRLGG